MRGLSSKLRSTAAGPLPDRTRPSAFLADAGFMRRLGLFDSTMIVVGSMIGSGIFIVSADIARQTGQPAVCCSPG